MTYEDDIENIHKINYYTKIAKQRKKYFYKQAGRKFREEHKTYIKILDRLVVGLIILSFLSTFITDILTIKTLVKEKGKENVGVYEANPATAEVAGIQTHPKVQLQFKLWLYISLYWFLFLFVYLWNRLTLIYKSQLVLLSVVVLYIGIMVVRNFLNDLAVWIGYVL